MAQVVKLDAASFSSVLGQFASRRLHLLQGVRIESADGLKLLGHCSLPSAVFSKAIEPRMILGFDVNQLLHRVAPAPCLGPLVIRAAVAHSRRLLPDLEAFPVTALACPRCSVPWPLRNGIRIAMSTILKKAHIILYAAFSQESVYITGTRSEVRSR